MIKSLLQEITLYHKTSNGIVRYPLIASYRGTSILNRNTTGVSTTDSVLIRIFYADNDAFEIAKDDVIVNQLVNNTFIDGTIPLTTLQNQYGKENVFKVRSIDIFNFDDEDLRELNHIKVGLI